MSLVKLLLQVCQVQASCVYGCNVFKMPTGLDDKATPDQNLAFFGLLPNIYSKNLPRYYDCLPVSTIFINTAVYFFVKEWSGAVLGILV